jgi:RimJ/RimL family protein N-acetyltransferase
VTSQPRNSSYWLLPEASGRELAFTAVIEMVKIAAEARMKSLVLDIEGENAASMRVAEHLGAERRTPTRLQTDRFGDDCTMVVFVLPTRSSAPVHFRYGLNRESQLNRSARVLPEA